MDEDINCNCYIHMTFHGRKCFIFVIDNSCEEALHHMWLTNCQACQEFPVTVCHMRWGEPVMALEMWALIWNIYWDNIYIFVICLWFCGTVSYWYMISISGPVFYLWLSKVWAKERRRYICNVFSYWLRPWSAIDRKQAQDIIKHIWYSQ